MAKLVKCEAGFQPEIVSLKIQQSGGLSNDSGTLLRYRTGGTVQECGDEDTPVFFCETNNAPTGSTIYAQRINELMIFEMLNGDGNDLKVGDGVGLYVEPSVNEIGVSSSAENLVGVVVNITNDYKKAWVKFNV